VRDLQFCCKMQIPHFIRDDNSWKGTVFLDSGQRLVQIGNNIVHVLDPNRDPH
jgi:hypothetical protein